MKETDHSVSCMSPTCISFQMWMLGFISRDLQLS